MLSTNVKKVCVRSGWSLVGLLVLILIAFSVKRALGVLSGIEHENPFELRYFEHPVVTALHMLSGIVFVVLAPLQFIQTFRNKKLNLHRQLGKLLVICALISGAYGMVSVAVLPAFGGLASETAGLLFGSLFMFSILRAYYCVRNTQLIAHREWMIRAFAIGLAVGTQRVLLLLFIAIGGYGFEESFGPTLWLGFTLNALLAEIWINLTRKQS